MLIEKYRNLCAASRTSDPLWVDYVEGTRKLDGMLDAAERAEYQREYDQHYEDNVARLQPVPVDGLDAAATVPDQVGQESHVSQLIEEVDENDIIDLFDDGSDDDDDEDEDSNDGVGEYDVFAAIRRHNVTTQRSKRGIHRIKYPVTSAYKDMLEELDQAQGSETHTADVIIKWFKICHGIDDFAPGEEPLPGQYKCRFCYQDLTQVNKPHEHVHSCAKTNELGIQKILLEAICPLDQPCCYQKCGHGTQHLQFVPCAATFANNMR